eukprot:8175064-Alexandrium_andersonii.AAC.1
MPQCAKARWAAARPPPRSSWARRRSSTSCRPLPPPQKHEHAGAQAIKRPILPPSPRSPCMYDH